MKIAIILAALALAGCASQQERIARVAELCSGFGYQAGTPEMSACEQQQFNLAAERRMAAGAALMAAGAQMSQPKQFYTPAQPVIMQPTRLPITTNCQPNGSTVQCQSF